MHPQKGNGMRNICRQRILRAGFKIYRLNAVSKTIKGLAVTGRWIRVGKYTTSQEAHHAFAGLMRGSMAIAD